MAGSKKEIPLRAKTDVDVREIVWFAGKQFIGKAARMKFWSGSPSPEITKLPRWTITGEPVRIPSLCDEQPREPRTGQFAPKIFSTVAKLLNPNST